jgi:hypothetical protein
MSVELIASAITAAIASGATSAAGDTAKKAVADAYEGFKSLLKRRVGADSPTVKAVSDLEADPESKGQQMLVSEKLAKSPAASDPEIASAAQALLHLLKAMPQGNTFTQTNYGPGSTNMGDGGTSTTHNNFGPTPSRGGNE